MPTIFDAETLTRLYNDAEQAFSIEFPCILDRLSLSIVSGTTAYTLPEYVHSIKRVTYKGVKVNPMPLRVQRQSFQSATQSGHPFWYIFNNVGQNKINLFPIPNETIAAGVGDLWGPTEIAARCIVQYWRVANNTTFVIPPYFERRLLKLYVAKLAFAMESRGQKIKNRDYFDKKWEVFKQMYGNLLDELHSKPRKLIVSGSSASYFPAGPMLPIDRYGVSVDSGE